VVVSLGSNIAALGARRALDLSSAQYSSALERLSSGQRINRASDDAAGLAIADSLRVERRLLGTAARNINDALSVTAVTGSAVQQQISLLTRLRELAEQSANGVYSADQRTGLSSEYRQLIAEFGRLADSTTFNGISLLQGSRAAGGGRLSYQVGTNGQTSSQITYQQLDSSTYSGSVSVGSDYNGDGLIDDADLIIYSKLTTGGGHTFEELSSYNKGQFAQSTIVDSSGATREVAWALVSTFSDFSDLYSYYTPEDAAASGFSMSNFRLVAFVKREGSSEYDFAGEIASGVSPGSSNASYDVSLSMSGGKTGTLSLDLRGLSASWDGERSRNEPQGTPALPWTDSSIDFTGVESSSRALRALDTVFNRLNELTAFLGSLGATESRLLSALELSRTRELGVQDAEGRIRDADIGFETARLVRSQVLQQAAQSILVQANALPRLALTLLSS
jgi:flagellin